MGGASARAAMLTEFAIATRTDMLFGDAGTRPLTIGSRGRSECREYIANIRHEVRTPLTALRTDLELLALDTRAKPARSAFLPAR